MSVDLSSGARFGRYRIDVLVDRGGMGVVYRATDVGLDRPVALKVILPELARDPGFRERFEREARAAARLDHPNVIPVHEAGEQDGVLFLAMRFVEGTDLRRVIAERGPLEPRVAARIVAQVSAALDAAHARGLIHRDVKPANVLLSGAPGGEHVYLSDFGLAKRPESDEALTSTGQVVGTLDYMAPEQVDAEPLDSRVDVYALGCLLFHALTGRVPYPTATEARKLMAHLLEPPPSVRELRPDVPAAFDQVVARAMAKSREERFQSAGELGMAAIAAAEGESLAVPTRPAAVPHDTAPTVTSDTPVTSPGPPATAPLRRRRTLALGAAVAGVAAAALAVLALTGAFTGEDAPERQTRDTVVTAPDEETTDEAPTPPEPPVPPEDGGGTVSEREAQATVQSFETAFADEDLAATADTLAPDVELLLNGNTTASGRDAVSEEFSQEFAASDDYRFDVESVEPSPSGVRVEGSFSQDVSGVLIGGAVAFEVVRGGAGPRIERIDSQIPG